MAHHMVIDTCVWLDLAPDPAADEIISRIEDLIATTHFRLVVPQVVREEFDRHKAECAEKLAKRLSGRVNETIHFVKEYAVDVGKVELIAGLEGFCKRIAIVAHAAAQMVARIKVLFDHTETKNLETTDEVFVRAAKRGYAKKAPFVGNKNSVADAIILETLLDFYGRHKPDQCTFSFVTLNKSDFADQKDQRRPHPDLGEPFTSEKIKYCINLAEEINRLTKELPQAPKREKKLLSDAVVRRVDEWESVSLEPATCPACSAKALYDYGWRGSTWHKRCKVCARFFDTGQHMDD